MITTRLSEAELKSVLIDNQRTPTTLRFIERCEGCSAHTKWLRYMHQQWICQGCQASVENALRT